MSNTEHSGAGAAHKLIRCTFGPARDRDLVWPPTEEDLDACSVVHLDQNEAPPRRIKPTFGDCRTAAPRVRPLMVPMEPPPLSGELVTSEAPAVPAALAAEPAVLAADVTPADAPPQIPPVTQFESRADSPAGSPAELLLTTPSASPQLEAAGAMLPASYAPRQRPHEAVTVRRSVWVGLFFAAAAAFVTLVEYRAPAQFEAPPVPPDVTVANVPLPAPTPAPVAKPAAARPAPAPVPPPALVRAVPAATPTPARPTPPPVTTLAAKPVRPELPRPASQRVSVEVRDRGVVTPKVQAKVEPRPVAPMPTRQTPSPVLTARVEPPPVTAPTPAPSPSPAAAAAAAPAPEASRPEPLASAGPMRPVAAVLNDSAADEQDIRTALTRFRTAYSQLNANAARDVWPSVDTRALERAFQSLKSQDLRFDSCSLTVTGARAQAACKGRAVYVPRIGDQSPRFTSREWNFELRKADERWTIASARSL